MYKFLFDILKFLFPVSLIYLCSLFVWGKFVPQTLKPNLQYIQGSYGFLNTRIKEAKETRDVDLLILGSSHAYRGFDVRIFDEAGFKTFNLGSSSQSPIQTYVILKRYLASLNPKLILFEVYPGTFCSDGVESSIDLISNDINDIYSLEMMSKTLNLKTFNTLIYGYMNDFFGQSQKFIETTKNESDKYITGGYVERETTYYQPQQLEAKTWHFNKKQFDAFYKIIDLLKKENIETILVFAPITQNLYDAYQNTEEFEQRMIKTNLEYINFNGKAHLTDSVHFYDSHHMNQLGVTLFNKSVLDYLENR